MCDKYPGQRASMRKEVEDTEKMLRDSTFYMPVTNEEKAAVYATMAQNFSGTGHWYYRENGHQFTMEECGMPMETSRCPQCSSPVGGRNHEAVMVSPQLQTLTVSSVDLQFNVGCWRVRVGNSLDIFM
jgi:hypothetical protein